MKKKKHNQKEKRQEAKKILLEKRLEENKKNRAEIENEINEILDELTIEELTELEKSGEFSKDALEWIRMRKKRKKAKKQQEEFEKRIRASDEVIRRTELIGKLAGLKIGEYKAKSKREENLLKAILEEQEQDIERGAREKDKERNPGSEKGRSGGAKEDDRVR